MQKVTKAYLTYITITKLIKSNEYFKETNFLELVNLIVAARYD